MKKFYSLLAVLAFAFTVNGQNLLTNGSFESWTDGVPDGWFGSKTNFTAGNVEESPDAKDGAKSLALRNTASGHKRFDSQSLDLEPNTTYVFTFWIKGEGEVRGGFWTGNEDAGGSAYSYGTYLEGSGDWTQGTYTFTTNDSDFTGTEVIFSVRNTGEEGILIDDAVLQAQGETEIIQVANIAELRAGEADGTIYQLTGNALLTFKQDNRNQKYVEDATGGVLIDDAAGRLAEFGDVGDMITGITGTLNPYNGLIQFVPTNSDMDVISSGNTVAPAVLTMAEYLANPTVYESKYIKINEVIITDYPEGDGTFQTGKNYDITQGDFMIQGRTQFYDIPLIGQDIPESVATVSGFGARFNDTIQIFILDADNYMNVNDLTVSEVKMTTIWNDMATFVTKGNAAVEIYNLNGQLVQRAGGSNTFNVNVSGLAKGVYAVKVTVDGKTIVKKAVKK